MKKVLVLTGSPRVNGNTDMLSDEFIKGAREAGHNVEKINITTKNICYCSGCGSCQRTGKCVINDDMEMIQNKMVAADIIVMATPVYFYNMSAQMKTLIDRTCPMYTRMTNKEFYIIMSAAEENKEMMNHVIESFRGFFDYLDNVHEAGVIYGLGAYEIGDIKEMPIMKEAYVTGKSV